MIYFLIRTDKDDKRVLCIIRADSAEQATKMVGENWHNTEWALCTTDEITALINTKEGYITKVL